MRKSILTILLALIVAIISSFASLTVTVFLLFDNHHLRQVNASLERRTFVPTTSPEEIESAIEQIARVCGDRPENEMVATSGTLFAVLASLHAGGDHPKRLYATIIPFVNEALDEIRKKRFGEDGKKDERSAPPPKV